MGTLDIVSFSPASNPTIAFSPHNTCYLCDDMFLKDLVEVDVWEYTKEQASEVSYECYYFEDDNDSLIEQVPQMTLGEMMDKAECMAESLHEPIHVYVDIFDMNVGPLRDLIYVASCEE